MPWPFTPNQNAIPPNFYQQNQVPQDFYPPIPGRNPMRGPLQHGATGSWNPGQAGAQGNWTPYEAGISSLGPMIGQWLHSIFPNYSSNISMGPNLGDYMTGGGHPPGGLRSTMGPNIGDMLAGPSVPIVNPPATGGMGEPPTGQPSPVYPGRVNPYPQPSNRNTGGILTPRPGPQPSNTRTGGPALSNTGKPPTGKTGPMASTPEAPKPKVKAKPKAQPKPKPRGSQLQPTANVNTYYSGLSGGFGYRPYRR